jgi:type III restriction enzyme
VSFANQHATGNGGKPWRYLLIPDNAIQLGHGIVALQAEFTQQG